MHGGCWHLDTPWQIWDYWKTEKRTSVLSPFVFSSFPALNRRPLLVYCVLYHYRDEAYTYGEASASLSVLSALRRNVYLL